MRRFFMYEKSHGAGWSVVYMLKLLLFTLLLGGLIWLLHLCPGCESKTEEPIEKDIDEVVDPGTYYEPAEPDYQVYPDPLPPPYDPRKEPGSDFSDDSDYYHGDRPGYGDVPKMPWSGDPGYDSPYLPTPGDNILPPIDPDDGVFKNPDDGYDYIVSDRLVILLNDVNRMEQFAAKLKEIYPSNEYYVSYYNHLTGMIIFQVPPSKLEHTLKNLTNHSKLSAFDYIVCYDSIMRNGSDYVPSDNGFTSSSYSWYFKPIQIYEAWNITKGSEDVTVAVVDNFIDLEHDELRGKAIASYSVSRRDQYVNPQCAGKLDEIGHGTHVAATVVGAMDNGRGVAGIAPNCKFIAVSIADKNGVMPTSNLIEGVMYAVLHGADVVNVSIGIDLMPGMSERAQMEYIENTGKATEAAWAQIFKWAAARNCIIVWAAGNDTMIAGVDPSKRDESTIRVSAVNRNLKRTDFSNYGEDVGANHDNYSTISAPGVDIYSAVPGNKYMSLEGTSMAAPIVTGAVALMKSIDKSITAKEAIDVLRKTGKPVGDNIGPLIQVADALKYIKGQMMDFEDIIDNPENIVGLWRSTDMLTNSSNNNPLTLYFEFTSSKSGLFKIVEKSYNGTEQTYTAKLVVDIDGNIVIRQLNNAGTYIRYVFECSPDSDGLMQVVATPEQSSSYRGVKFNLKKIN